MPTRKCNPRLLLRPHRIILLGLIVCAVVVQIWLLQSYNGIADGRDGGVTGNPKFSSGVSTDTDTTGTSSTAAKTTAKSTTTVNIQHGPIFYNLFVPDKKKNRRDTERIVKEQLVQRQLTSPNATIRYTLIGDTSFQDFVSTQCHDCQLDQSLKVGDEKHTLQSLWEYCNKSSNESDVLVTYIHDKGSFHQTEANEKARRMATKAAMECRNILPQKTHVCNICMGAFHIFPQYLASANMWTAQCSYIRQLYPPQDYAMRLQQMYDTTLNHSVLQYSPQYVCLKPYDPAPNFWGLGRYAYERWALSHPKVKPCTSLPMAEGHVDPDEFPPLWQPKFRKAPQDSAKSMGIETGPYKSTFARLQGRLFEWEFLYNQTPPSYSWIWKFYKGYEQGAPMFLKKCQALTKNVTQ